MAAGSYQTAWIMLHRLRYAMVSPGREKLSGLVEVDETSLLKQWRSGTHQGSVGARHMDCYLDEFTFRINRRASHSRGLLFCRLLEQSVVTSPVSYQDIVHGGKHNI